MVFIAEGNTSEENTVIGTVKLMPKKKSTKKSKTPPLNKRYKRKDQGNPCQLLYMERWWKPRSNKSKLHFSHLKRKVKLTKLPDRQGFPGFCILCPKQYYTNKLKNLKLHFKHVHVKRHLKLLGVTLLLCKCC